MYVKRFGPQNGPPVLLLHGGGVAGWMWDSLRRSLDSTYSVLIPDLPGHGASADQTYHSSAETTAELAGLITRESGGHPAAVIGFSWGGQLAMELASVHPELVDRAIIVSAQARPVRFTGLTLSVLQLSAPLARKPWFARLQARSLFIPAELMDAYVGTSARISADTLLAVVHDNLRFDVPAGWSDFHGPTVVMVGRRERRLMRNSAALIHDALPSSELEVIEECGHGIPFQQPEWFSTRVLQWLDG